MTYATLVARLRQLLPPPDQEWTEHDYIIQEAAAALETAGKFAPSPADPPAVEVHDYNPPRCATCGYDWRYCGHPVEG